MGDAIQTQSVVLDVERRLEAMERIGSPIWLLDVERSRCLWANAAGREIWDAKDLVALRGIDLDVYLSGATRAWLEAQMRRVENGEEVATWLPHKSTEMKSDRASQSWHQFRLSDGRLALLVECRIEPPVGKWQGWANYMPGPTVGLYDHEGCLVDGSKNFRTLCETHSLEKLQQLLPSVETRDGRSGQEDELGGLEFDITIETSSGPQLFRAEVRVLEEGPTGSRLLVLHDTPERQVSESDEASSLIMEAALEAIVIVDESGLIVEFNSAAEVLFGRSRSEVLGLDLADVIIPVRFGAMHKQGLARYLSTGTSKIVGSRVELPALRADGSEFVCEVAIVPLAHRGRRRLAGFIRDVDALKRAEALLREERARFLSVFEYAPDPILITDENDTIVLANHACRAVLGWEDGELVGQTVDAIVGTDGSGWRTSQADESESRTLMARRKDGGLCSVDLKMSPLMLEGAAHKVVSLRDVTARVQAVAAREQLAEQLLQSQKMEALGTLAGGVAHYFNNLLAAIMGNVELALSAAPPDTELQTSLGEISEASERGADLVRRILRFSHRRPVGKNVQALPPLVDEVVGLVRHTMPAGVLIESHYEPELAKARVDPTQFHQVLVNLVTNSYQAIEPKTGRVDIRLSSVVVGVKPPAAGLLPGPYVHVSISDTGHGMEPETLAQVFDPFFTTKPVGRGTGLGLAEVHGIAADHGGAVTIRSEPGVGTTVDLYLPAASSSEPHSGRNLKMHGGGVPGAKSGRILFVDDDQALLDVGVRLLTHLGHAVTAYQNPSEALSAFVEAPMEFDVLVTDLKMPEMSGYELAEAVSVLRQDIDIVMLSGASLSLEQKLGVPNTVHMLEKPYTVTRLSKVLDQALQ